jgi:hypothetical protein
MVVAQVLIVKYSVLAVEVMLELSVTLMIRIVMLVTLQLKKCK